MGQFRRLLTALLTGFVRSYQLILRPWLPPLCRYQPTCSAYAIEALRLHGPLRGSLMAGQRICRCHPFHAGGFDPVPLPKAALDAGVARDISNVSDVSDVSDE